MASATRMHISSARLTLSTWVSSVTSRCLVSGAIPDRGCGQLCSKRVIMGNTALKGKSMEGLVVRQYLPPPQNEPSRAACPWLYSGRGRPYSRNREEFDIAGPRERLADVWVDFAGYPRPAVCFRHCHVQRAGSFEGAMRQRVGGH